MFKVLSDHHICISALDLNVTNSKLFYYASYSRQDGNLVKKNCLMESKYLFYFLLFFIFGYKTKDCLYHPFIKQ